MQDFRKVRVWQASRELAVQVYRVTRGFPADERFGLTSQMRRAALSMGANLAEGCGRGTDPDTRRFVQMAYGPSLELLHFLIISQDLSLLEDSEFQSLDAKLESLRKQLSGLLRRLSASRQR